MVILADHQISPLIASFYSWQFIVLCVMTLAGFLILTHWVWRRKEAKRKVPRYDFDDQGRLVGVTLPPPPNSHAQCTWFICMNPDHGPCRPPRAERRRWL